MGTILSEVKGFTPIIDVLARETSLTIAAVYGVAWRYCQMEDKVCRASLETIAKHLGVERKTVERHLKTLCGLGYLKDTTPGVKHKPHIYQDTGKAKIQILVEATVDEKGKTDCATFDNDADEVGQNAPPRSDNLSGTGKTICPIKKEVKETIEETKESDAAAPPPVTAKHPAIKAFRESTHRYPAKSWYQKVGDAIGTNADDVQFWRDVVYGWVGCGWNPVNIKGMLECYAERRIPSTNGKGNSGGSFKRSSGAVEPVDQATSLGGKIIDEFSASELADLGILEHQGDKHADG